MLNKSVFKAELQKIFDYESELFEGWPKTRREAAERWSRAFNEYAKKVVPKSTSYSAARSAFENRFMMIGDNNGIEQFQLCFFDYAVALAPGMLPTYASTPPSVPPILKPVFYIGYGGGSSEQCINKLVDIVDTWMRTGRAKHTTHHTVVPWS